MSWSVRVRVRLGALDLDVELGGDGGPVALVGPNGSGKTTLLRTIAGAHRPDAGQIRVGERVLFHADRGVDLPPEARRVGYVPQGYGLFPHLTVRDNVAFGWIGRAQRRERGLAAGALLERMGCAHLADRRPDALSGGERQRVALARALLIEPHLLLLDEPLAALDAPTRRALRAWLAAHLRERGRPALVVTHDARDVLALNARVYVLEGGRIVQEGVASEVAGRPATAFVAEFFGVDDDVRPERAALRPA